MKESIIKYGIMGGTFDPIHMGHLVLAEEVRNKLNLDKIIFIPSGNPPHKEDKNITTAINRYEMTLLATTNNPFFEISDIEIYRNGKTYTIDTIKQLRRKCSENVEFYFITGADAILDLPSWKDYDELLKLCKFVAATRPGYEFEKMQEKTQTLQEMCNNDIYTIIVPALQISSTDIRKRIREGQSVKYLLPETVENYIYKNKLYIKKILRNVGRMKRLEIREIQRLLKEAIGTKRYIHSLGVMDTAIKLASKYNFDTDKAALAGLVHDCGKLKDDKEILKMAKNTGIIQDNAITNYPALIHGPLGAIIAKDIYGINDEDILEAVKFHTTGKVNMKLLDKIIYLSDYIEPNRSFPGINEIRELAYVDMDRALLMAMENTIIHIINKGLLLHYDTVSARNDLIANLTRNGR